MKLENKVAIVTGGANGIGRAIAFRLANEGARVVIADVDLEHANEVRDKIRAMGREALVIEVNVTKGEDSNRMAKTTLDEFERIDILVNNVGGVIRDGRPYSVSFQELPEGIYDAMINLNVKGVINCCRSVAGCMVRQHSGKIVNIGSVVGIMGSAGTADLSLVKGAVIAFTKAVAKELAPYGINVNCVSPGAMDQPGLPKTTEHRRRQKQTIYLPRFGRDEDIANMVAFLVSDEASYVVGQNIPVCGGRSLGGVVDKEW